MSRFPIKSLAAALMLAGLTLPASAGTPFSVMLDWFVNPDHGPIIVAKQRGYFKDAGLDVEIIAPADPSDPPKMAAAGEVDLGVSYQPQLYLQHKEGLPVVRVGSLIDSPLYCIMVDADGPVKSLADLKGGRVGFSVPGIEEALMHRMLRTNGVEPDEVEQVNVNFALTSALAAGKVDAVGGAFRNFELHQMAMVGRKGKCFFPEENGVPVYEELIYETAADRTDFSAIKTFLKVTARAAEEIAKDPEGTWEEFKGYAAELDDQLNHDAWFDTYPKFSVKPMALDKARYEAFGAYLNEIGMIEATPPLDGITHDLSGE
nr:ABC transporter substrate-binding protein [uncultured Cohaesibacter sp.]